MSHSMFFVHREEGNSHRMSLEPATGRHSSKIPTAQAATKSMIILSATSLQAQESTWSIMWSHGMDEGRSGAVGPRAPRTLCDREGLVAACHPSDREREKSHCQRLVKSVLNLLDQTALTGSNTPHHAPQHRPSPRGGPQAQVLTHI